jgi:hypothetical protein
MEREDTEKWNPIGWLKTKCILNSYKPILKSPDGGFYSFVGLALGISLSKPTNE